MVGLLHGRLNNVQIQDWVILFQQNSCLISDIYEDENISFYTQKMVGESAFLFDKSVIITLYYFLLAVIDQHATCFEYVLSISLTQRKICVNEYQWSSKIY